MILLLHSYIISNLKFSWYNYGTHDMTWNSPKIWMLNLSTKFLMMIFLSLQKEVNPYFYDLTCFKLLHYIFHLQCVLVKGWKGSSWSFPRGKKNKDEEDHKCAIREVRTSLYACSTWMIGWMNEIWFLSLLIAYIWFMLVLFLGPFLL